MNKTSAGSDAVIFVNYRRTDTGWAADRLADELKKAFGQDRVFFDVRGIDAGDDFSSVLKAKLHSAAVLLVVIGNDWLSVRDKLGRRRLDQPGDWVRREIHNGLRNKGCEVIPVLIDDANLPTERNALPKSISQLLNRQAIRVRQTHSGKDLDALIETLVKKGSQRITVNDNADILLPRSSYCAVGPLTLGATLNTPLQQGTPDAYPTGKAGAHFIFDLHNPNRIDFIVLAIEVEVISYQAIDIEILNHGVGATGVTRRFHARVQPALRRYQATFLGEAQAADYVKILPEETEVFDVEVSTLEEGLYELLVHVLGSLAGNRFDVPIDHTKRSMVFFDRESNYRVNRWPKYMSYSDYIEEISTDACGAPDLARYRVLHADA